MTAAEIGLQEDTELERAGYSPAAAAELAGRSDVDLHLAIDLVRQGCPHEVALSILL